MRSPEEVKTKIVRQWLAKAEQDLGAVEALLETNLLLFYPACFHAQQAVEKCLKAFLTWRQIEFPKTHSIRPEKRTTPSYIAWGKYREGNKG